MRDSLYIKASVRYMSEQEYGTCCHKSQVRHNSFANLNKIQKLRSVLVLYPRPTTLMLKKYAGSAGIR